MSTLKVSTIAPLGTDATKTITMGESGGIITRASGANANFAGVKVAGMWRINTGTNLSADTETTITAGWEEVDSDGYGTIGSSMSVSSGIWTFPETGIYQILWNVQFKDPQAAGNRCTTVIAVTTDNSSYSTATDNSGNFNDTSSRASILASHVFDVTDTTTHKCKLNALSTGTVTLHSADSQSRTWVQFIRLGDT